MVGIHRQEANKIVRHRFHSLCPYFAMFPETFAEKWIDRLTKPGEVVLDPFCGRGTTPFQALLMKRKALACDVNPVAYCVTRAKTNAPDRSSIRRRITSLEREFDSRAWENARVGLPPFFRHAYSSQTLRQLLYLRNRLNWRESFVDCMIAALTLGSLHGESERSESYLSNQMPRTISTKPAYSIRYWERHGYTPPKRDAFNLLRQLVSFRYESCPPRGEAEIHQMDMRDLPRRLKDRPKPGCVITSPPYRDVTSFEEDQWLRIWFLGGEPNPTYRKISRDDRHESSSAYWNMISDMWRVLGNVVGRKAHIVIRLGDRKLNPEQIVKMLTATSLFSNRRVRLAENYEVSEIRRRQTTSFLPGSKGCLVELDCHFRMD